jgi:uncharacterized protein (TIGR03435 family)
MAGVFAAALISSSIVHAQSSPDFEVASVKPNKSANERGGEQWFPNRYSATNIRLRTLIHAAYGIPDPYGPRHYLAGGPDWIDSDHFDVEGKVGESAFPPNLSANDRNDQIRLMLQTLLADRFQLKVHREVKEVPMYKMVVGKNGPKLQTTICERRCQGIPVGSTACPERLSGGMGRGITAKALDLSELAQFLSGFADRPILNKTGIKGLFDIKTTPWRPVQPGPNFAAEAHADPEALPTIFTMLEEQLGLRLISGRGPVEILVIDHERPSEN